MESQETPEATKTGQPAGNGGATSEATGGAPTGPRTATLNLPFVTAQFRAPRITMPHMLSPNVRRDELTAAAQTARSFLPPPKQALYYAGLAALAATEVIEWPIAAAIAVGVAVTGPRGEGAPMERRAASEPAVEQSAEPVAAAPAATTRTRSSARH